jgi:uncharacterized protein with von Willebrand factor type A (vWA) domain
MDAPILRFVSLLRQRGVRVSPAETLDALRGLSVVPLGQREVVKTALRATLIKEERDDAIFDELFEAFFSVEDRGTSRSPRSRPTSTTPATPTRSPPTSPSTSTSATWPPPSGCTRTGRGSTWPGSARS